MGYCTARVVGSLASAADCRSGPVKPPYRGTLGLSLHADLILIDERKGASIARQKGLVITGTLGVLVSAKHADLLSLAEAFSRLRQTTFHCSEHLMAFLYCPARKRIETTNGGKFTAAPLAGDAFPRMAL